MLAYHLVDPARKCDAAKKLRVLNTYINHGEKTDEIHSKNLVRKNNNKNSKQEVKNGLTLKVTDNLFF